MLLKKTLYLPLLKSGSDTAGTIVGYASVFGVKDEQGDIVIRGAFMNTLHTWRQKKAQPAMLWQHDMLRPCGVWQKTAEDPIGLLVRGTLGVSPLGREALALVKRGAVTGLSIGYRIVKSHYDPVRRARILSALELDEISLVTMPANRAARISGVKAKLKTPLMRPSGARQGA